MSGWEISADAGLFKRIYQMREARVPSETGGILFGLVDIPAKRIHLVHASTAPADSDEKPGSFVRGVEGVEELMDTVRRRTAGQVRYVGEWHSHPPRVSARPSAVDGQQIDWLAALMDMDSMPALMLIAAEEELRLSPGRAPGRPGPSSDCHRAQRRRGMDRSGAWRGLRGRMRRRHRGAGAFRRNHA